MQEIRKRVSEFIVDYANKVKEIIDSEKGGFYFGEYVQEWDEVNHCGTICCMEGYAPMVMPDRAKWDSSHERPTRRVVITDGRCFFPEYIGVPMHEDLWDVLTMPDGQSYIDEPHLDVDASFEDVYDLWLRVAQRVLDGDLDDYLIK